MNPASTALQFAFIGLAAVSVYGFAHAARNDHTRASCKAVCELRPAYAGENRLAPDFELSDMDGKKVRLSEYRGRTLVLNFWTKTCKPCLEEMPALAELAKIVKGREDIAVMNLDDKTSKPLMASVHGSLWGVSSHVEPERDGAWLSGHSFFVRRKGIAREVASRGQVTLRGDHNLANVVMASGIAAAAGFPLDAIAPAVESFRGVPHRLEVVGRAGSVTYINDSIATSPERTMAGLRAFTEPVVLLLGGREKKLPLDGLQDLARERCRAVVCFGEAGDIFADAMRPAVRETSRLDTLDEAIAAAASLARPGDVVLFSPAGTSFDRYPSFEVRGAEFRKLVAALPGFDAEVRS